MRKESCFWLLILAVFTLSFVSCEGDNDPIPVPDGGTRTVLVYVVADNNLSQYKDEDYANADVDEMMEGMKQVNTSLYNLLVYVDDYNTAPVLYRLVKDKSGNVVKEVVKRYDEQVSTDVTVMKEVVNRAFNAYPADSYGLVYWSHGEGWLPYPLPVTTRWVGQDEHGESGSRTISRMNILDLASVLQNCPHLDFLLFDACFMQSVEVAYDLRSYTDYVIGSPTEIPGPGAPYDKAVPKMFVSDDSEVVSTEIAKAYFDYYNEIYDESKDPSIYNWTGGVSIGVLKTSALEKLATVTRDVLPSTIDVSALVNSGSVFNYDKRSINVSYYDMDSFIKSVATDADYAVWRSAFEEACIYWKTTKENYSSDAKLFSMQNVLLSGGVSQYLSLFPNSRAGKAYQSCAWYTALGLSKYGW